MGYHNCVYLLINKINGKRYVGKTTDFNRRCNEHKSRAKKKYLNYSLYVDIHNVGFENFRKIVLKDNLTHQEMNELEQYYIKFYNTLEKDGFGYNVGSGGDKENKFKGMSDSKKDSVSIELSKRNHKKVAQYDSNGKLINTFNSYKDAQNYIGCRIQSLDYEKPKLRMGYYWLRYDEIPLLEIEINRKRPYHKKSWNMNK